MAEQLSFHRKRRGVARASLTKLATKVTELEGSTDNPDTLRVAQALVTKLKSLDHEFKSHHLSIVDLTDGEESLAEEQEALDSHDDQVGELNVRVQRLVASTTASPTLGLQKSSLKRLTRLREKLVGVGTSIDGADEGEDGICTLQQCEERIGDLKKELREIQNSLVDIELEAGDPLVESQDAIESAIFECCLSIKKRLRAVTSAGASATSAVSSHGAKLPKLEVPTFNGDLLNWKGFWEQFCVSVHDRTNLSDTEKLVYLQNALKDSTAKRTIEGLTKSGEHYEEAVKCLKSRYDRPRQIHQVHVRRILEAPPLKDGSGKELRHLHDLVLQHLRALKGMGHEPSDSFMTALLELKLDVTTMFEWQRHTQDHTDVPSCQELLDFVNLRAQAAEASSSERKPLKGGLPGHLGNSRSSKPLPSFASSVDTNCVACKGEKHPLYSCSKFKTLPHDRKLAVVKSNNLCINCLRSGHFVKECKSLHRCRTCQKPHHSLLHSDTAREPLTPPLVPPGTQPPPPPHNSCTAARFGSDALLMTCQVLVTSPHGPSAKARALLDPGSTVSFVSDQLARSLRLSRSQHSARVAGVAGLSCGFTSHSITAFQVSSWNYPGKRFDVSAIVVPCVTCDLPTHPVPRDPNWSHLERLQLADPTFGDPKPIDLLLGVDLFAEVLRHGRRVGPPSSPMALETALGWVLAGAAESHSQVTNHVANHVALLSGDELLQRFWEAEEPPNEHPIMSSEEMEVVKHFQSNHTRTALGRFVVPLPRKPGLEELGESRSQAVRRFLALERSLHSKKQFAEFADVVNEYFTLGHAEPVPVTDTNKPPSEVFYLPMHAVKKPSSTTTKLRVVFDGSAKSTTGVSLNDTLMVGPNIHSPLLDVLLRFRLYRIALTADVSKMYRAIELSERDKDYHRFVWRKHPNEPLIDYRMTRITFGISASSFAANMCMKQNALDFAAKYPLAADVVDKSLYVDDCLTGADSVEQARSLQAELQALFDEAKFLLRKWNTSDPAVLDHVPPHLKECPDSQVMPETAQFTKTLGIEWESKRDIFRLTIADPPVCETFTKRLLVSDLAKTFDVLGWLSPTIIKAKILLQRLWERKVDWDQAVPCDLLGVWQRWRSELRLLSHKLLPRCYFPRDVQVCLNQLHGFCDASEDAFAAVVYLRTTDQNGMVHTSLVISKTRVAPLKKLTIPRLELCGAHLLSRMLPYVKITLDLPECEMHAWTDSTVVLGWLAGDPRRFKTYVGNRVSRIIECVPSSQWRHVSGLENPADCASRGIFPSELLEHDLWWKGPSWLRLDPSSWPRKLTVDHHIIPEEEKRVCFANVVQSGDGTLVSRFSTFTRLKRVTAWILRFITNTRARLRESLGSTGPLSLRELSLAETHWFSVAQNHSFPNEIDALKKGKDVPAESSLYALHPFIDDSGLMRVGGRVHNSGFAFSQRHPVILYGQHKLTKLIIETEHVRLLHAGPTLVNSSLSRRFHIVGQRRVTRSLTRACVTCRRTSARPQSQLMGQLPPERVTPGMIFEKVGIDYAGPVQLKLGRVRKPTIVKAYICVFVALSVKAIHLELVSDLTSAAFIACLRRFIARRGKPSTIWSDHGSNFVGAARELAEFADFLKQQRVNTEITDFCTTQGIEWSFIPEHAPHFGGLWESAVRSVKTHLKRVLRDTRLTFEEYATVLTQVEACLNSRPLAPLSDERDCIEALTPGHFLIGRPVESLPDPPASFQSVSVLRRWNLCQIIVRHFWQRWSTDYFTTLRKFAKWHRRNRNAQIGDLVLMKEDGVVPTKWPLGKVVSLHPGKDGVVRVVKVKTSSGMYTRPVTKIALLLPSD